MATQEKEIYLIPMEVTNNTIKDFGIKNEDVKRVKIGNKIISAILVPATKEQYEAYMRPIWTELKREERNRRCVISNGKGKLKRCDNDCKTCNKTKNGSTLSLDTFFEETGLEFVDEIASHSEAILSILMFEDLLKMLQSQSPELAIIFEMLYDSESKNEIADFIDRAPSTVADKITRMRKLLQQHVSREDLVK